MARNLYPVSSNFPIGLNQNLLATQMPSVWPADAFPADYTTNGRPGQTVTTGTLVINTSRELTPAENAAAVAFFQTHDPNDATPLGTTIAELPIGAPAGTSAYVRDLPRATGPGDGAMAYSDGQVWRRFSNDLALPSGGT